MSNGTQYVVGFLLSPDRRQVVLVRKNRPRWQAGRLNGVGGKIEPTDPSPAHAMAREFAEEAGVVTNPGDWEHLCSITWADDLVRLDDPRAPRVEYFRSVWRGDEWFAGLVESRTDEAVGVVAVVDLPWRRDLVPNLKWLVPLAAYQADRYEPFTVVATTAEVLPAVGP